MIELKGQVTHKKLFGKLNIIPSSSAGLFQAKTITDNGHYIPAEEYDGFSEVLVNVFIDFDNLPTVDSIEKPVPGSPVAVIYDGAVYVLCEGEYENG